VAIGLNDISKKRRGSGPSREANATPEKANPREAGKSTTIRPWGEANALKPSLAPRAEFSGTSFDDLFDANTAPLFWLELSEKTRFSRLQGHIAEAEIRLREKITAPFKALRIFLGRSI